MEETRFRVPTYYGVQNERRGTPHGQPEFGGPLVRVVVRPAGGLRIVLGSHNLWDGNAADIQIERRPNGWALFLHPAGSGDASGFVCFLDHGRSYVVPEQGGGPTPPIEVIDSTDVIPELDRPTGG